MVYLPKNLKMDHSPAEIGRKMPEIVFVPRQGPTIKRTH